jgi:hypothetical protein
MKVILYEKSAQRRTPSSRSLMQKWLHKDSETEVLISTDDDAVLYGTFGTEDHQEE